MSLFSFHTLVAYFTFHRWVSMQNYGRDAQFSLWCSIKRQWLKWGCNMEILSVIEKYKKWLFYSWNKTVLCWKFVLIKEKFLILFEIFRKILSRWSGCLPLEGVMTLHHIQTKKLDFFTFYLLVALADILLKLYHSSIFVGCWWFNNVRVLCVSWRISTKALWIAFHDFR